MKILTTKTYGDWNSMTNWPPHITDTMWYIMDHAKYMETSKFVVKYLWGLYPE